MDRIQSDIKSFDIDDFLDNDDCRPPEDDDEVDTSFEDLNERQQEMVMDELRTMISEECSCPL